MENKKQKTEGAQGPTASPLVPVEKKKSIITTTICLTQAPRPRSDAAAAAAASASHGRDGHHDLIALLHVGEVALGGKLGELSIVGGCPWSVVSREWWRPSV